MEKNSALVFIVFASVLSGVVYAESESGYENASSLESPLVLKWKYHVVKGVDSINVMDLNGDGRTEIYACSLDPTRSTVSVLDSNGGLIWDTSVPRYNSYVHPTEEIKIFRVGDFDDDHRLEIVAGSEIHDAAINIHPLYYIKREAEREIPQESNKLKWTYFDGGLITGLQVLDWDSDGVDEILTSSDDSNVRVINLSGMLEWNQTFETSVWSVLPVNFDSDPEFEILVGLPKSIALLDGNETRWSYATNDRVSGIYYADGRIFAVSGDTVHVLDRDGILLWKFKADGPVKSNIHSTNLNVFKEKDIMIGDKDKLKSFSGNGSLKWVQQVQGNILSIYSLDIDSDGREELMVGSDEELAVYQISREKNDKQQADSQYAQALQYHENRMYREAYVSMREANTLYRKIYNQEGISKTSMLMQKYEQDLLREDKTFYAQKYYLDSLAQYNLSNYSTALLYAEYAKGLYANVSDTDGVGKVDYFLYVVKETRKADENYNTAEGYYIKSDYENALKYAQNANEIYVKVKHANGILKSGSLVAMCTDKINKSVSRRESGVTTTTVKEEVPPAEVKNPLEASGGDKTIIYAALLVGLLIILGAVMNTRKNRGGKFIK